MAAVSGLVDLHDPKQERHSESESATNDDSSDNQIGMSVNNNITTIHESKIGENQTTLDVLSSDARPLTPNNRDGGGSSSKDSSTPKHKLNSSSSSLNLKKSASNKKARHR